LNKILHERKKDEGKIYHILKSKTLKNVCKIAFPDKEKMKGSKTSDETIKELYASERCLNDELLEKRCMQCGYFNMRDEGNEAYARYCDETKGRILCIF